MVDDEPMPIEVLAGLVPLVVGGKKGTPGWPAKGSVVLVIGAQVGGGWFTSEEVAEFTARAGGTCRRQLAQLENERVVIRDAGVGGEGGGGGLRYWCEINPRWEDWRVMWAYPRRVIRQKVAFLREMARTTDYDRFIARHYGARYPEKSARVWERERLRREAAEAALARIHGARDNGSAPDRYRAKSGGQGRSRAPVSRAHGRALFGPNPGEIGTSPGVVIDELSPSVRGPAPPKRESPISINPKHRTSAHRAVLDKAAPGDNRKRPAIWGSPVGQIDRLVADHGIEAFLAACGHIQPGVHQVPSLLGELAGLLDHGVAPSAGAEPAQAPLMSRLHLEQRRRNLKQLIATYEALKLPVPERELADLQALDDELAK